MNTSKFFGIRNLLFLSSTLLYSPAWGTDGTRTITENTILQEDHNGTILIKADNITLDCNGHIITGRGSGCEIAKGRDGNPTPNCGIELNGRERVTVKNCRVQGFLTGIYLHGTIRSSFENNDSTKNSENGFILDRQSNRNRFVINKANDNTRDGFELNESRGNRFIGNEASGNTRNGIELNLSSDNNVFERNMAHNNGHNADPEKIRSGFSLDNSGGNTFEENEANDNGRNGFRIEDSSNDNDFIANKASGNNGTDSSMEDCKQEDSFRNEFLDNVFGNADQCGYVPLRD